MVDRYAPPFEFGGATHQVTVDVSGDLDRGDEVSMQRLMAQPWRPSSSADKERPR